MQHTELKRPMKRLIYYPSNDAASVHFIQVLNVMVGGLEPWRPKKNFVNMYVIICVFFVSFLLHFAILIFFVKILYKITGLKYGCELFNVKIILICDIGAFVKWSKFDSNLFYYFYCAILSFNAKLHVYSYFIFIWRKMFRARVSKFASVCTKPIVNRFVVSGMFAPIMFNLVRGLVLSLRSSFCLYFSHTQYTTDCSVPAKPRSSIHALLFII